MYTYVFENKEYEVALNNVKAILFDVVTKEEEKLTAISNKAMNNRDVILQQTFIDLRSQQEDCLKLVLSISNELAETLKKLDSYSRELRHIEDKNVADIIASITVSNGNENVNTNYNANNSGFNNIYSSNNNMGTSSSIYNPQSSITNNVAQTGFVDSGYQGNNFGVANNTTMNASNNVPENKVVEEVMPYDDGISTIVEEVVDYVQEEPVNANANGGTGEVVEEVMPYDDGISTVVEEVVDYVQEEPANANAAAEGEVVEEVMPYDDEVSTISADEASADANAEGEVVEEVMPYDDEVSTISAEEASADANGGTGEVVEEVMPYDDEVSTISADETSADANAAAEGEVVEEVMPYDDEVSTISAEEASADANGAAEGEVVEEVMPYDDEVSTISADEANADANGAAEGEGEVVEGNSEEAKSTVKLVIPGASNNTTSEEKKENDNASEEVSSGPLIIPTADSSSNDVPVENNDASQSNTLVIPTVSNNNEEVVAENNSTIDPALEAVLATDNSNKVAENKTILYTFKKRSNDLARAILTSGKQNKNLRNSLATQEALLKSRGFFDNLESTNLEQQLVDNGLLPADANSQIEQMMTEANSLYAAGKVEEAQAMFDKISELNKQNKDSEVKAA